eukprot:1161702-Pelagomonas_calceolata.AAC.10
MFSIATEGQIIISHSHHDWATQHSKAACSLKGRAHVLCGYLLKLLVVLHTPATVSALPRQTENHCPSQKAACIKERFLTRH